MPEEDAIVERILKHPRLEVLKERPDPPRSDKLVSCDVDPEVRELMAAWERIAYDILDANEEELAQILAFIKRLPETADKKKEKKNVHDGRPY